MIENKIKDTVYYMFENIDSNYVDHLFSSRIGWEDENNLLNNMFESDKNIISLKQVHGDRVKIVDEKFLGTWDCNNPIEGDGLLTNRSDIILKTYHADCTPLYFIDYKKGVVGVAHAGWRGTFSNIMSNMIDRMERDYNSEVRDINIFIGPAIKSCCYEVGKDLFLDFKEKYALYEDAFIIRDGKYYLDTQTINYNQALSKGIDKDNLDVAKLCTSCNVDRFYSYRKENGTNGRLITAISLKNRGA